MSPLGLPSTFNKASHIWRYSVPVRGLATAQNVDSFLRRPAPPTRRQIPYVSKVLLVASGKGGVGKSTVAVNLATSLALLTSRPRIGLLDLDIYGPSIPTLLGLSGTQPETDANGAILPLTNHGLKCMSIGFLLPSEKSAVVWRGLMVQKATQQLLFDVDWRGQTGATRTDPGLDCLVVDMPPGTGDVQLTIAQLARVDGAVIVSTPQEVALLDAKKGITMFGKVSIPTLGLILNQSYFTCPDCTSKHHLYGSNESFLQMAKETGTSSLGELPISPCVSRTSDEGIPDILRSSDGEYAAAMKRIARQIWEQLHSGRSQ